MNWRILTVFGFAVSLATGITLTPMAFAQDYDKSQTYQQYDSKAQEQAKWETDQKMREVELMKEKEAQLYKENQVNGQTYAQPAPAINIPAVIQQMFQPGPTQSSTPPAENRPLMDRQNFNPIPQPGMITPNTGNNLALINRIDQLERQMAQLSANRPWVASNPYQAGTDRTLTLDYQAPTQILKVLPFTLAQPSSVMFFGRAVMRDPAIRQASGGAYNNAVFNASLGLSLHGPRGPVGRSEAPLAASYQPRALSANAYSLNVTDQRLHLPPGAYEVWLEVGRGPLADPTSDVSGPTVTPMDLSVLVIPES